MNLVSATRQLAPFDPSTPGRFSGVHRGKLEIVLRRALERSKLPRIRVHDLRHVFASHFVMGGGDIFTLQKILGHSTPQLTSDFYAHLSPKHLAGEGDRVSYPSPMEGDGRVLSIDRG